MLRNALHVLCVLVLTTCAATAQSRWEPSHGPWGGTILTLAPTPAGSLYLGTTTGLYRSDSNGTQWTRVLLDPIDRNIGAIGATSSSIFVGSASGRLYRSNLDGASWNQTSLSDSSINSIAVTPSGRIFVATSHFIYTSADDGAKWVRTDTNIRFATVVVTDAEGIPFLTDGRRIFRTFDDGLHWQPVPIPGGMPGDHILSLQRGGEALYVNHQMAGRPGEVLRSVDGGQSWGRIDSPLFGGPVLALGIVGDRGLLAATDRDLFRSSDAGTTWSQIAGFADAHNFRCFLGIGGDRVFAATLDDGLQRSADSGSNWISASRGIASASIRNLATGPQGIAYADNGNAIYSTGDNGLNWTRVNFFGDVHSMAVGLEGTLYVGACDGLSMTSDNGVTWRQETMGLVHPDVDRLVVTRKGTIFATIKHQGLMRSTDGGSSWWPAANGLPSMDVDAIAAGTGDSLFCGIGGELFLSADDGESWTSVGTIAFPDRISAIAVDTGGTVHVGAFDGGTSEFRLREGGWDVVETGLDMGGITDLKIGTDGTLYAASRKSGAFRRPPGAESWVTFSAGLEISDVEALALLPDGYLLAGLDGGSVVQMDLSTVAGVHPVQAEPSRDHGIVEIGQLAPNPVTDGSRVRFSLSAPAWTTVRIVSPEGKAFAPLIDAMLESGRHSVVLSSGSLAPGNYYLSISAAGNVYAQPFQVVR